MKFLEFRKNRQGTLLLVAVTLLVGLVIFLFDLSSSASQSTHTLNAEQTKVLTLLARTDSLKNYNIKQSVSLASDAEKITIKRGLDSLLPKVYMTQGKLLVYNSEYPQALEKLLAAETYYAQVPDPINKNQNFKHDYAICLQRISEVHFQLNRLDKALEYIEASIKI